MPTSQPSTGASILDTLAGLNGYVALGLQIGSVLIPLFKGLISEIKGVAGAAGTIDYQVLIKGDSVELQTVVQLSTDDILAISSELARMGKPTIPVPKVG